LRKNSEKRREEKRRKIKQEMKKKLFFTSASHSISAVARVASASVGSWTSVVTGSG
jgi:hypothetical protein